MEEESRRSGADAKILDSLVELRRMFLRRKRIHVQRGGFLLMDLGGGVEVGRAMNTRGILIALTMDIAHPPIWART